MKLLNWWKRWKRGDAVCKVASPDSLNRVYNVLEDIDVMGLNGIDATINKPTNADGKGWTITIDAWPITKQAKRLPFDIVKRENDYAVWIGAEDPIAINNDDSIARDSGTTITGGFVSLGNYDNNEAWLWIGCNSNSYQYKWGISTTYPQNYTWRYIARWQIGEIDDGKITQLWRGRIRFTDSEFDGVSVERTAYVNNKIQLYDFAAGQNTSADLSACDFLYRFDTATHSEDPSEDEDPSYVLRYMNGTDIKAVIEQVATEIMQRLIDSQSQEFSELKQLLDQIYQPLVSIGSTSDQLASSRYVGIVENGSGVAWEPA